MTVLNREVAPTQRSIIQFPALNPFTILNRGGGYGGRGSVKSMVSTGILSPTGAKLPLPEARQFCNFATGDYVISQNS